MPSDRYLPLILVGCSIATAAIAGCGDGGLGSQVSGYVTLDGKAIGPGVVVFAPEGNKRNPATGAIQPNGNYTLKTANTAGLIPGKYTASVSVIDEPIPAPGVRNMNPGKQLIPEKFTSTETSQLNFDVTPGNNTINIELKSK